MDHVFPIGLLSFSRRTAVSFCTRTWPSTNIGRKNNYHNKKGEEKEDEEDEDDEEKEEEEVFL